MALSLDRKAFIEIITDGQGDIGGVMLPPPEGVWGMPQEVLQTFPGYDLDVEKNRAEARKIMEKLGYGSNKRLETKPVPPSAFLIIPDLRVVAVALGGLDRDVMACVEAGICGYARDP
jgi:hypothetical protein